MTARSNGKKLNGEQIAAIEHGDGPLLIIAGAGTGKTTVVTERINWLIQKGHAKPSEILALTFTEKAAKEMEERVDKALPYGYTQLWISTFHSFGDRVLRQEAIHIGLDPGYRLMSEAQSVMFFRKHVFSFSLEYFRPLGNPNKFIGAILEHFSRLKDEDIAPVQYLEWAANYELRITNQEEKEEGQIEGKKYLELANTYKKYEELKTKEGVADFGDLISNTLRLFRKRPNILKNYQEQFKYILIDEFQDTNFAQNELAVLLAGKRKNITVVGDDDQAIYRWRGAAISNIIQFRKRFPGADVVVLTKNYRSTGNILDASYKLIVNNNPDRLEVKEGINKQLTSERKIRGSVPAFLSGYRVEDEAHEVVSQIKSLKSLLRQDYGGQAKLKCQNGEDKYEWKDFAILVRANAHADPFTRALSRAGIPYQFLGPGRLFRQPEVMDLIAYLNVLNDFSDSVSLYRVLSLPVFSLGSRDIQALMQFSRKIGVSLFEAMETVAADFTQQTAHWSRQKNYHTLIPPLTDSAKGMIARIVQMENAHLARIQKDTAGQILYDFIRESGLLDSFSTYETPQQEKQALNVSKFFDRLRSFESQYTDASVPAVVDWIRMSMEMGESPLSVDMDSGDMDAVNILTIHASKGLEFPIVFVVNLVNGRFPTRERQEKIPLPDALVKEVLPEGDYHLEEERRLAYVAMTRARDYLFLSAARLYGEGIRERKLAPFVAEALGEQALPQQSSSEAIKQLSLMEWGKKQEPEPVQTQIPRPVPYLSYSQIDTFQTCPLQYKYRYVLKIPVPTSAAASFGTSIHMAMQRFYELRIKNNELRETPTKTDLLNLLDEVWIPQGYGTKQYEDKMKERGRRMLEGFYEKGYDPNVIPQSLEQIFKIRVTPSLAIGGKIDRVDMHPDGTMEIIDYKTGRRPTDKQIKENLQMTVYALAATDKGIYGKPPEKVILSFYFFEAQEKVSGQRTAEQLTAAEEKLKSIAREISVSDFIPTPGPWCDFCDFRMICPAWK